MNYFFRNACLLTIFLLGLQYQITLAQNRIVGGHEVKIKEAPYMLYMQIGRKSTNLAGSCGASIISKEWALTAAHCFSNPDTDYSKITVIGGTADLNNVEMTVFQNNVTKVIIHELYKGVGVDNNVTADITLIKISPPMKFSKGVKPVRLPEKWMPMTTSSGTVSGWGHTKSGGQSVDILRSVTVPKIDTAKCKKDMFEKTKLIIKPGEICYGFSNSTVIRDKCQGDSGGPLVNPQRIQLGIVSWGIYCGSSGIPGVYTEVLYFRDWIKKNSGV